MVRQDLSFSQQAVQACHVCLESGKHFPWVGEHPHLVLANVPDEPSLERWLAATSKHPYYKTVAFREPDMGNSLTAVAVAGVSGKSARSLFRPLPLVTFSGEKTMTTVQSRWGFHPCNYETYKKLKRLNILAIAALCRAAEHNRWERKDPQNRRIFIGSKGHDGPCRKRDVSKSNRLYKPMPEPALAPIDGSTISNIIADYRNARTPVAESEVKPLVFNEQKINSMLAAMEKWYKTSLVAEPLEMVK
jgi:hypothetical protein